MLIPQSHFPGTPSIYGGINLSVGEVFFHSERPSSSHAVFLHFNGGHAVIITGTEPLISGFFEYAKAALTNREDGVNMTISARCLLLKTMADKYKMGSGVGEKM